MTMMTFVSVAAIMFVGISMVAVTMDKMAR